MALYNAPTLMAASQAVHTGIEAHDCSSKQSKAQGAATLALTDQSMQRPQASGAARAGDQHSATG